MILQELLDKVPFVESPARILAGKFFIVSFPG